MHVSHSVRVSGFVSSLYIQRTKSTNPMRRKTVTTATPTAPVRSILEIWWRISRVNPKREYFFFSTTTVSMDIHAPPTRRHCFPKRVLTQVQHQGDEHHKLRIIDEEHLEGSHSTECATTRLHTFFLKKISVLHNTIVASKYLIATFGVARLTLQTRELWCRDRPWRALPLICPCGESESMKK